MSAISNIVSARGFELSLLCSVSGDAVTPQSHEAMRAFVNQVALERRQIATSRRTLADFDWVSSSVEELESLIEDANASEAKVKIERLIVAQQAKTYGRSVTTRGRGYLRPAIDRVAYAWDVYSVEHLELLRDLRWLATAELASRPSEKDGQPLGTREDIKAYFDRLIAA